MVKGKLIHVTGDLTLQECAAIGPGNFDKASGITGVLFCHCLSITINLRLVPRLSTVVGYLLIVSYNTALTQLLIRNE